MKINNNPESYCKAGLTFPCEAVEFLRNQSNRGNIFNQYGWGGYLIWKLPEYGVFIDGRMSAWLSSDGRSPVAVYEEIMRGDSGWQQVLENADIDWVLVKSTSAMAARFQISPDPGWQEAWRNKTAVVYKRAAL